MWSFLTFFSGKSTLWADTSVDQNLQRDLEAIGPYEFQGHSYGPMAPICPNLREVRMDQWPLKFVKSFSWGWYWSHGWLFLISLFFKATSGRKKVTSHNGCLLPRQLCCWRGWAHVCGEPLACSGPVADNPASNRKGLNRIYAPSYRRQTVKLSSSLWVRSIKVGLKSWKALHLFVVHLRPRAKQRLSIFLYYNSCLCTNALASEL